MTGLSRTQQEAEEDKREGVALREVTDIHAGPLVEMWVVCWRAVSVCRQ